MDLAMRGYLLAGFIVGMFAIALVVLLIGRRVQASAGDERFDTGRKRKRKPARAKQPAKKPAKKRGRAAGTVPLAGAGVPPVDGDGSQGWAAAEPQWGTAEPDWAAAEPVVQPGRDAPELEWRPAPEVAAPELEWAASQASQEMPAQAQPRPAARHADAGSPFSGGPAAEDDW